MSILDIVEDLEHIDVESCIFGCGKIGVNWAYPLFKKLGIRVDFFADNNVPEGTEIVDGLLVKSIQYLYDNRDHMVVFVGVSNNYQREIRKQLIDHGFNDEKVITTDNSFTERLIAELDQSTEEKKKKYYKIYDDKAYLEDLFREFAGYELNLEHPRTFNEKLQWLKLFDRRPEYPLMVDKFEVKKLVSNKISEINVINTIGIWDSYDNIPFDTFPDSFVLKCTHDSGSVLVVKEKSEFDPAFYRDRFNNALSRNYYYSCREWPYKNVQPRIMAEEYKEVPGKKSLPVYKFFCFNGKPKIIQAIENDKQKDEVIDYYDTDWQLLELRQNYPNSPNGMDRPVNLGKMLEYAEILSEGHPFIRVDFYEIDNKVYFSEFTFFSDAGFASFTPPKWDKILGEYIKLPIDD